MELVPFDSVYDGKRFEPLKKTGHIIDISSLEAYEQAVKGAKSAVPDQKYWSGKRVLITGASGMVGSTMADVLIAMGAQVYGTIKRHAVAYHPNLQHNLETGKLKAIEVDLRDYGRVVGIMKEIEPHAIFHQAAESFVPTSIQQPSHVVENNCVSTVNVLEAATKEDKSLEGIQLACSSEQYGFVKSAGEIPIKEESELRPTSTYAVTKVFTDYIARAYYYMYKTPTVITRTFNQEGPRRGPQFFTARIGMQIASCLAGKAERIVMGNPNSVRDFLHVHDSVKAQIIAVEKCNRGEVYNICSGKGISTGDYATLAMRTAGLHGKVPLLIDKSLLRTYERGESLIDGFIGDNSKIAEKTGWRPTKSVVDIVKDGVEYYKGARQ